MLALLHKMWLLQSCTVPPSRNCSLKNTVASVVANNPSNANIAKVGRMLAALRRPGDFICTILIENINKH